MARLRARLVGALLAALLLVPMLFTSRRVNEEAIHVALALQTEEGFWDALVGSDEPWLVEFFDPRCSSCQAFAPVWKDLVAAPWAVRLRFASVSIEAPSGMDLAKHLGVIEQGLPNVQLFTQKRSHEGASAEEDDTGAALGRPMQHLVMEGGELALTAPALRQRVLNILHAQQLEQLGIVGDDSAGDGPDEDSGGTGIAAADAGRDADDLGD